MVLVSSRARLYLCNCSRFIAVTTDHLSLPAKSHGTGEASAMGRRRGPRGTLVVPLVWSGRTTCMEHVGRIVAGRVSLGAAITGTWPLVGMAFHVPDCYYYSRG